MRLIFFSAIILFLTGFTASAQGQKMLKAGRIQKKGVSITMRLTNLENSWEKHLAELGTSADIRSWKIVTGKDEVNKEKYYLLVGTTSDLRVKIASRLVRKGNALYLVQNGNTLAEISTITCSGCKNGCYPVISGGSPRCTSCETGDCTKSVTVSSTTGQ
ncbi:MAG: hypothetical protein EOP49_04300 [Sphingobacteriales bacterium]|nr:MAG: hypothetical protein EOP49_04300 [Sphingobacteriales bacterium]